jgi:hypothetical protein
MQEFKQKKPWYKSKTILSVIGTVGATIASNPPQSKQDWLQVGILVGGGLLTGAFRKTAKDKI